MRRTSTTDNWYASLTVIWLVVQIMSDNRFIAAMNTYVIGLDKTFASRKRKGNARYRAHMRALLRSGIKVFCIAWQNRKPVHILSTLYSSKT